jgi:hypothetical protein
VKEKKAGQLGVLPQLRDNDYVQHDVAYLDAAQHAVAYLNA